MCFTMLPRCVSGLVVKGFGRGSKTLGIPTANLPDDVVSSLPTDFKTGVYYGWAALEGDVYKMVASVGWNPFFKNEKKTLEIHLLKEFPNDFYGKNIKAILVGYIRPEKDFSSVDELIKAIRDDIEIAQKELDKPDMLQYKSATFFN